MVPVIVVLLIIGCILILASFIFKDSFSRSSQGNVMTEAEIERLVERRFSEVKYRLDDEAEKSADIIKDQTERELEKLSNEKIMAVNEYSDQVMDQINKNHNEVMFLYSMLSDKQKELDHAVEKLNRVKQEAENKEKLAERTAEKDSQMELDWVEEQPKSVQEIQPEPVEKKKQTERTRYTHSEEFLDERYANKERILQMSQEGCSSLEIARRLHLGIGEVQLVLELSKERQG